MILELAASGRQTIDVDGRFFALREASRRCGLRVITNRRTSNFTIDAGQQFSLPPDEVFKRIVFSNLSSSDPLRVDFDAAPWDITSQYTREANTITRADFGTLDLGAGISKTFPGIATDDTGYSRFNIKPGARRRQWAFTNCSANSEFLTVFIRDKDGFSRYGAIVPPETSWTLVTSAEIRVTNTRLAVANANLNAWTVIETFWET